MKGISNSYEVGKDLLGPIMTEFLENIYEFLTQYNPEDTVVFFMARGGLGIRYLLEQYLAQRQKVVRVPFKDFYTSRLAVAKGCYRYDKDNIVEYIASQFKKATYAEMIESICKHISMDDKWKYKNQLVTTEGLKQILLSDDEVGRLLNQYLLNQSSKFKQYIDTLSEGKKNIIIVDTGWLATSQHNLMRAYPNKNWIGCYFGKWDYYNVKPTYFTQVYGLGIDQNTYNKNYRRASILFYHHIIEGTLEPKIPSTEEYVHKGNTVQPNIAIPLEIMAVIDNAFFNGIHDYIQECSNMNEDKKMVERAYRKLAKMIMFPNTKQVEILKVGKRGANFGRALEVDVIQKNTIIRFYDFYKRLINVRRAIWKQGQMVYEFPYSYRVLQLAYFLLMYNRPIKP